MGSGNSKSISSDGTGEGGYSSGGGGGQLYVSVKLESFNLKPLLVPHVYGSVPVIGSWESSQAVSALLIIDFFLSPFLFSLIYHALIVFFIYFTFLVIACDETRVEFHLGTLLRPS